MFVNQLSLYGAVAEMCEEYETFHVRTGQPVVGGQSSSSLTPSVIKTEVPLDCDDLARKDLLLQQYGERIEKLSQQDKLSKFCMDAGFLNVVEIGQYFMTTDTAEFSQFRAAACRDTLCQETKKRHNKITKAPCRRRIGGAVPRAANFGDLITADHKVLSENGESRNNHRYAVVVQDLATQWIQVYPCKTKKLHRKLKEARKSSWSRLGSLKSFTLSIPWNSAKLVKIFPGIIAHLHHIDQKQMGLLREQCAESRKAPLLYCCNQV